MFELFQESIKAPNLPATFLLLLVMVFWVVSLLGFADLDLDLSTDVDADMDMQKDVNITPVAEGISLILFYSFFM